MKRQALLALLLVLGATAGAVNPAHDQLMKLSDADRNAMFTKLLQSSGEKCSGVSRNFLQGVSKGDAYWNVACKNGTAYVVMVKGDAKGSTQILDCSVMKAVGGTPCFTMF